MEFKLKFELPSGVLQCTHYDSFVFLGSCFAEEMAQYARRSGFHTFSNPFGVVFHPHPLALALMDSIQGSTHVSTCQRDDLWFSWDAAAACFAYSESELHAQILEKRARLREALENASVLVITFGTAWAYSLQTSGKLVANCHKFPSNQFHKTLSETGEMVRVWESVLEKLQAAFPHLHVLFTVSPVRHVKDGLVENNRSKARLIELVHSLNQRENVSYFPAYEIVLDELRDYRFYAEDLVHPSTVALDYVWDAFRRYCMLESAVLLAKEVERAHEALQHRSLHPGSKADRQRAQHLEEKFLQFKAAHPEIYWQTP